MIAVLEKIVMAPHTHARDEEILISVRLFWEASQHLRVYEGSEK